MLYLFPLPGALFHGLSHFHFEDLSKSPSNVQYPQPRASTGAAFGWRHHFGLPSGNPVRGRGWFEERVRLYRNLSRQGPVQAVQLSSWSATPFLFSHFLANVGQVTVQRARISSKGGVAARDLARELGCDSYMECVPVGY